MDENFLKDVVESAASLISRRASGESLGFKIGLPQSEKLIGGELLYGSNLIIGARTGVGKSALANILAMNIAELNADKDMLVNYYNWEMTAVKQGMRILSNKIGMSVNDMLDPTNAKNVLYLIDRLKPTMVHNINFIDKILSTDKIYIRTSEYCKLYPNTKLVNIYDHSRIVGPDKETRSEADRLHKFMKMCNAIKKEYDVTNIILTQLNRSIETTDRMKNYSKPVLSDIFGSDAIAQYADIVWLLHRPDKYGIEIYKLMTVNGFQKDISTHNMIFNEVVKNRDGQEGTLVYSHDLAKNKIEEVLV